MIQPLRHRLKAGGTREQAAKQAFVSGLRAFILNEVASAMQQRYAEEVAPAFAAAQGHEPRTGMEVHRALKGAPLFKLYSSMRYNAQEMVWRSVLRPLAEGAAAINASVDQLAERRKEVGGSLRLNPALTLPDNVTALDVHLAPGSYHREEDAMAWLGGAVYDHGLNVFSFGQMGRNLDDIGHSFAQYVRHRFPEFAPQHILDMGCAVGHNSCAWKQTFPESQVTAIDVAAACLRYGHARALDQGVAVDFRQMNATALDFADNSMDLVFSSMFLHELPVPDIRAVMREAHRVLRPGGLMLHMELPPNGSLAPYDAFYLDWDAYYNNEPFYKTFRDQDFTALRCEAGFAAERLFDLVTPQYTYMDAADYAAAIAADAQFSDRTGRLTAGVQWYGFGAWKQGRGDGHQS